MKIMESSENNFNSLDGMKFISREKKKKKIQNLVATLNKTELLAQAEGFTSSNLFS